MNRDVHVGDGVAIAASGDVLLVLWKAPATPERIRWQGDKLSALFERQPGTSILFQLILPSSSPPDAETRKESNAQIQRFAAKLRRIVIVAVGDEMWTNVVRTIMRAALILTGQASLLDVVGSESEGLSAVARHALPATPPRSEVERAIGSLRRSLDERTSQPP